MSTCRFLWIPEGPRKIVKISKIDHFGGFSENCQTNVKIKEVKIEQFETVYKLENKHLTEI